ncbi:MAG: hypothetical protein U0892_23180 [Pirellulales bacterium]
MMVHHGEAVGDAAIANQLLTRALRESVWGPAVACRVRQSISLVDRKLFGVGQYAHGGGSAWGKMKLSIRIPAGDQVNTLQQISDGRVLYTTRHIGDQSLRTRVNIERVREQLGTITRADFQDPMVSLYLAIGGQPELLRTLCQQYHWYWVRPGKLGDVDVWWLRGRRAGKEAGKDAAPLKGQTELDLLLTGNDPVKVLPEHVQIAIGNSAPLPYWLYRVEQTREHTAAGGEDSGALMVTLEFMQPQIVTHLPEELFEDTEAKSSVDPIVDETKRYLPPPRTIAGPLSSPSPLR